MSFFLQLIFIKLYTKLLSFLVIFGFKIESIFIIIYLFIIFVYFIYLLIIQLI